ncbi:MAG: hypothetical protein WD157_01385, partial [Patescibacteria group bacterium]
MSYRYLGKRKTMWLIISGLLLVPGILSLIFWKLPLGIDFRGGGTAEWQFAKSVTDQQLRDTLGEQGILKGFSVSSSGEGSVFVKFLPIEVGEYQKSFATIKEKYGQATELKFENVGPSVSKDLTKKAIIAVVIASLFILVYLAYSFRGVTYPVSSWRFG